ncbi:sensor histidine kinase [Bacteroides gallinaceum]|uniref:sensor histidine kinase n=1 Tax=Bacteroides gallinaceum TaxID=1462571 RepID=UPI0025AA8062|nr:HAMP domain-containing sensor histidine kinase [Bacteroides gallinaceum]MDN0066408.1 HAMP domain-containing sensor histidine kinase [Bacteroides gallinaceum]
MKEIRHLRWIALIALLAIAELQYVWLANSYRLAEESLRMKADEVFRDASLEEAFHRMSVYKERKFGKDTTLSMKFEVDTATSVFRNMPNRWLMSSIHTGLQDYIYAEIHQDVSLPVLDSIYAHMLDSAGIRAEVASCITDSTGRVLRSSVGKELYREGILKTDSLMLDFDEARFVQGIITNPYWVIARRMTLVLIATVLIIAVAVVCVVWQVRIILRQDKVAKLREDFSYAMIHDMKTPLSSIVMGTRILETGRLDSQPEKRAQYFRILREEGEHLISLTNKVLTLAKLEHRQLRLDKTECLLRPMLEDLATKYQAKAEKPIRYVWKLDAPAVYADEEFLREALSNLIDNAVKYSGSEVEITFASAKRADGSIAVSVRDNGLGIPLKDQAKIFEKYERASAASRSRGGGAPGFGLGLNYVLRIVEAHGGTVKLESIEGEYSEFTLVFPKGTTDYTD